MRKKGHLNIIDTLNAKTYLAGKLLEAHLLMAHEAASLDAGPLLQTCVRKTEVAAYCYIYHVYTSIILYNSCYTITPRAQHCRDSK